MLLGALVLMGLIAWGVVCVIAFWWANFGGPPWHR